MAEQEQDQEQVKKPKKPLPIFMIIMVLNLMITGGAIGAIVYFKILYKREKITEVKEIRELTKEATEIDEEMLIENIIINSFDNIRLNLKSGPTGKQHYALVTVNIECPNNTVNKEIDAKKPIISDIIVRSFQKRTFYQLTMVREKIILKSEIIHQINTHLKTGKIINAYFSKYRVM